MASPAACPPMAPATAPTTPPITVPTGPATAVPMASPAALAAAAPSPVATGWEPGSPVRGSGFWLMGAWVPESFEFRGTAALFEDDEDDEEEEDRLLVEPGFSTTHRPIIMRRFVACAGGPR